MTKIDIISGFLGAGKTTLIKKLLQEALKEEKVVLIENEFGEIGIDGGFLKEAGIEITEMNSGCICCSLVGDFRTALTQILDQYHPDRIIIEPTGVGKLSDVIKAVQAVAESRPEEVALNAYTTVADANKCKLYHANFGEFYNDQIASAGTVIFSRSADIKQEKLENASAIIREINPNCAIITTDWNEIDGKLILQVMEQNKSVQLEIDLDDDDDDECCCGHHHDDEEHEHHHHHHEDGEECCCGHHHDDEEHEHHHHHHEDGEECCCGHHHDDEEHEHHHHHHEDGEECCCGHHHDDEEHEHHHHHHEDGEECCCGHHHGHHHHHADEVFTSWGVETPVKFTKDKLDAVLEKLSESDSMGMILRAKGIVPAADADGVWYHFDLVPGEYEIRTGAADYTGRLCVIGAKLKEEAIAELFGL